MKHILRPSSSKSARRRNEQLFDLEEFLPLEEYANYENGIVFNAYGQLVIASPIIDFLLDIDKSGVKIFGIEITGAISLRMSTEATSDLGRLRFHDRRLPRVTFTGDIVKQASEARIDCHGASGSATIDSAWVAAARTFRRFRQRRSCRYSPSIAWRGWISPRGGAASCSINENIPTGCAGLSGGACAPSQNLMREAHWGGSCALTLLDTGAQVQDDPGTSVIPGSSDFLYDALLDLVVTVAAGEFDHAVMHLDANLVAEEPRPARARQQLPDGSACHFSL